jgi:rhomboid-like protein
VSAFGPENFVALYASAGVLSSLGGLSHKLLTNCTVPSLGASGALMFLVGSTALLWPDARFGVILLPGVSLEARQGLLLIVCIDTLGLLLRWRALDHAAHLAGTAFGAAVVAGGGYAALTAWQARVVREWRAARR